MTDKQFINMIKRINQRMTEFESKGLTDASTYKRLNTQIQMLSKAGLKLTQSGKLSTSKANISYFKKNSHYMVLGKMLKDYGSLKSEIERAKKYGAKSMKEIYENIRQRGKLETWCEENLEYVYKDAKSGLEEAQDLQTIFDTGKVRNMSYDAVWAMIYRYEKAVQERNKIFEDSTFNKGFFK